MDKVKNSNNPWAMVGMINAIALPPFRYEEGARLGTLLWVRKVVIAHYGISLEAFLGKKRTGALVYTRQAYIYWIRKNYPSTTLKNLGKHVGNRDHTSAMYSVQEFENRLFYDAPTPLKLQYRFPTTRVDYEFLDKIIRETLIAYETGQDPESTWRVPS